MKPGEGHKISSDRHSVWRDYAQETIKPRSSSASHLCFYTGSQRKGISEPTCHVAARPIHSAAACAVRMLLLLLLLDPQNRCAGSLARP